MAAPQKYLVFGDAMCIKFRTWFWSVRPQYINVFFENGRCYQFREDEGFRWEIKENDGLIMMHGWTQSVLAEVRERAGRLRDGDVFDDIDWEDWGDIDVVGGDGGANAEAMLVNEDEYVDLDVPEELLIDDKDELERRNKGYDVVKLRSVRRRLEY